MKNKSLIIAIFISSLFICSCGSGKETKETATKDSTEAVQAADSLFQSLQEQLNDEEGSANADSLKK